MCPQPPPAPCQHQAGSPGDGDPTMRPAAYHGRVRPLSRQAGCPVPPSVWCPILLGPYSHCWPGQGSPTPPPMRQAPWAPWRGGWSAQPWWPQLPTLPTRCPPRTQTGLRFRPHLPPPTSGGLRAPRLSRVSSDSVLTSERPGTSSWSPHDCQGPVRVHVGSRSSGVQPAVTGRHGAAQARARMACPMLYGHCPHTPQP